MNRVIADWNERLGFGLEIFGNRFDAGDVPHFVRLSNKIGGGTTQAKLNMVARSIFKCKFDLRK